MHVIVERTAKDAVRCYCLLQPRIQNSCVIREIKLDGFGLDPEV